MVHIHEIRSSIYIVLQRILHVAADSTMHVHMLWLWPQNVVVMILTLSENVIFHL